jgi:predicted CoA-substrate-specific enzyme activase
MMYYICKYTPVELFAGFGEECRVFDTLSENFDRSDSCAHANLCGYGKSVIEAVLGGNITELVLVNCCDTIRRCYDVIKSSGKCRFLYLLDLPHETDSCSRTYYAEELLRLYDAYAAYSGKTWDGRKFAKKCAAASLKQNEQSAHTGYIGLLGAHSGTELEQYIEAHTGLPVRNLTCTGNRNADFTAYTSAAFSGAANDYAAALLRQLPCQRMNDNTGRRTLWNDPALSGIIYLTIKFCDYYGAEYADIRSRISIPLLKIESDFTKQSEGQLSTRIEAFAETIRGKTVGVKKIATGKKFFVGIDSGSTSTDVVVIDSGKNIVAQSIIATGAGAEKGARKCLQLALDEAHLNYDDIANVVTTGYGREYIRTGDESITEISCHAKGAFFLEPSVRTVIDIGGQDSKVIVLNNDGTVSNFVMNDKCAAGTGRFIEAMARALGMSLDEISRLGMDCAEDITISSMCTVFAESEVVSLVAQNKSVNDIVHGIDKSVAAKVASLASRLHTQNEWMMTGGVAQNGGIVNALESRLGIRLHISDKAQLCGALGAALYALGDN